MNELKRSRLKLQTESSSISSIRSSSAGRAKQTHKKELDKLKSRFKWEHR